MTAPPPAALRGYPADGQADVPTDVVPFYDINTARITDVATAKFVLTSSEGAAIAVQTEQPQVWYVDLLPASPLQPNTTYRIDLSLPDGESVNGVSFRTSAGPFEGVPEPPTASLQHYQYGPDVPYSSCSPSPTGTCVAVGGSLPVEATDLWQGNALVTYLYLGSFATNLSGIDQGRLFDCVSLRSRAPNRVYSAAVQLCRDDGPLLTLSSAEFTCSSQGLVQAAPRPETPSGVGDPPSGAGDGPSNPEAAPGANDDARDSNESSSCSFSAPGSPAQYPFALLLAAVALPLLRRRLSARTRGRRS